MIDLRLAVCSAIDSLDGCDSGALIEQLQKNARLGSSRSHRLFRSQRIEVSGTEVVLNESIQRDGPMSCAESVEKLATTN